MFLRWAQFDTVIDSLEVGKDKMLSTTNGGTTDDDTTCERNILRRTNRASTREQSATSESVSRGRQRKQTPAQRVRTHLPGCFLIWSQCGKQCKGEQRGSGGEGGRGWRGGKQKKQPLKVTPQNTYHARQKKKVSRKMIWRRKKITTNPTNQPTKRDSAMQCKTTQKHPMKAAGPKRQRTQANRTWPPWPRNIKRRKVRDREELRHTGTTIHVHTGWHLLNSF